MAYAWELPTSLQVGGVDWRIRTDFRAILDILVSFADPDFEEDDKWLVCLDILYEDFKDMDASLYEEAMLKATDFIDMGMKDDGRPKPRTMDWEQDAAIIIPSVNRVMGTEVRAMPYCHWWTFLGAYMEIGESLFSQVVSIRTKKARGKKLEKWEQEFYANNKSTIDLKRKYSEEEIEEQKRLISLLDGVK